MKMMMMKMMFMDLRPSHRLTGHWPVIETWTKSASLAGQEVFKMVCM